MAKEVQPSDFSDEQLQAFIDATDRLEWVIVGAEDVPGWISEAAEAFSKDWPRPSIDELRLHIQHAVTVARGWDDPDHPKVMLHSALKSFIILAWLDYLEHHPPSGEGPVPVDVKWATRVTFTPVREVSDF